MSRCTHDGFLEIEMTIFGEWFLMANNWFHTSNVREHPWHLE